MGHFLSLLLACTCNERSMFRSFFHHKLLLFFNRADSCPCKSSLSLPLLGLQLSCCLPIKFLSVLFMVRLRIEINLLLQGLILDWCKLCKLFVKWLGQQIRILSLISCSFLRWFALHASLTRLPIQRINFIAVHVTWEVQSFVLPFKSCSRSPLVVDWTENTTWCWSFRLFLLYCLKVVLSDVAGCYLHRGQTTSWTFHQRLLIDGLCACL